MTFACKKTEARETKTVRMVCSSAVTATQLIYLYVSRFRRLRGNFDPALRLLSQVAFTPDWMRHVESFFAATCRKYVVPLLRVRTFFARGNYVLTYNEKDTRASKRVGIQWHVCLD